MSESQKKSDTTLPIACTNLSLYKLRQLNDKIADALEDADRIDPYTVAHLADAQARIELAVEAQYIRNLDDIKVNLRLPNFFMQPGDGN